VPLSIVYRKGNLEDIPKMHISEGLSATAASIEFNVLGMGHEWWIAVKEDSIIGLSVLGRPGSNEFRIMYLEVAPSQKNRGVGSNLIQAMLANHPSSEFSVNTLRRNRGILPTPWIRKGQPMGNA
jgi:ribosomal protein S18 acetylase RimI-like enzyme